MEYKNKSKNKSNLKLKNLYVDDILFKRKDKITNFTLNYVFKYSFRKIEDDIEEVALIAEINSEVKGELSLIVSIKGVFENLLEFDEAMRERVLKQNTLAIMFPYLRSQVSVITSQPGLTPIVMPPMNILSLIDKEDEI